MAKNVTVTPKFKNEPFEKLFKRFRNQVDRAGIIRDVKRKEHYEKPSVAKNRKNQEQKRARFNAKRKQLADEQRANMLRGSRR